MDWFYKMMILERTIYPVGFGAFFKEKFLDPNGEDHFYVVYDCGSCTQGMNTRICSIVANEIPKVDVLFISHFHQDHINEIHQLPITKDSIVVLPYICDKYQQLYEFIYQMEYTQILAYLIQTGAKIVFVDPLDIGGNEGVQNIEGKHIEETFDIERIAGQQSHCFPFNMLKYAKYNWLYIPFHLQDKSVYKTFVADVLSTGVTVDELLHFDGKDRKLTAKLKRLYTQTCKRDKVSQNFNVSTMLLVSRPKNANRCVMDLFDLPMIYTWKYLDRNRLNGIVNAGCLYTGDMYLNAGNYLNALKLLYPKLMPFGIGMLQLPHHGSENGFDPFLYNDSEVRVIFSNCEEKPGLHHPKLYLSAVMEALRGDKIFIPVTEKDDTRLELGVYV